MFCAPGPCMVSLWTAVPSGLLPPLRLPLPPAITAVPIQPKHESLSNPTSPTKLMPSSVKSSPYRNSLQPAPRKLNSVLWLSCPKPIVVIASFWTSATHLNCESPVAAVAVGTTIFLPHLSTPAPCSPLRPMQFKPLVSYSHISFVSSWMPQQTPPLSFPKPISAMVSGGSSSMTLAATTLPFSSQPLLAHRVVFSYPRPSKWAGHYRLHTSVRLRPVSAHWQRTSTPSRFPSTHSNTTPSHALSPLLATPLTAIHPTSMTSSSTSLWMISSKRQLSPVNPRRSCCSPLVNSSMLSMPSFHQPTSRVTPTEKTPSASRSYCGATPDGLIKKRSSAISSMDMLVLFASQPKKPKPILPTSRTYSLTHVFPSTPSVASTDDSNTLPKSAPHSGPA